jgi:hypothetical protein
MNKTRMQVFFLRDVKTKKEYIHPTGDHMFQSVYGLRIGKIGACCFNQEQVNSFFAKWEGVELEKEELKQS